MLVRSQTRTLKIDGLDVAAHENETILDLARQNGIFIPRLCQLDGLSIQGACRLCLVEVKGWNKLVPACATYAEDGMEITTSSERLGNYRKMILELLFAEGNHLCAVCVSNGNCELQWLATKLGMDHVRFSYVDGERTVDLSHARYGKDDNRCILCTRCVRVCDEVEWAHTWDVKGRGINARVITDFDTPWGDSETCTSCGKCVNVCPTGALFEKGKSVAEMVKRIEFLPYITQMKEARES